MRHKHLKSVIEYGFSRYECLDDNIIYFPEYLVLFNADLIKFLLESRERPLGPNIAVGIIILYECFLIEFVDRVVSKMHVPVSPGVTADIPVLTCRKSGQPLIVYVYSEWVYRCYGNVYSKIKF